MSMVRLYARVCPCCGYDVARVQPVPGGFRLLCDPELMGCGADSAVGLTEADAVKLWNNWPSPGARALIDQAAARLLEMAGAHHG